MVFTNFVQDPSITHMKNYIQELPLSPETSGILILACAVLIFAMNQKYSLIVSRIRKLKEIKKGFISPDADTAKEDREKSTAISNIELQISHLMHRISMVRFSIVGFILAILFLVVHTILLTARPVTITQAHYWLTISFLYAAFLAIATSAVLISIETWKGYRIVRIEISETTRKK